MTVVSQAVWFSRRLGTLPFSSALDRRAVLTHRRALSWAAPVGAVLALVAAAAGAAFRDRPTVFGAMVLAAAVVILSLLARRLVARILAGLDAEVADRDTLRAELDAAHETTDRLRNLAYHDALTGLPNRSLLYDRLGLAIAHSLRQASPLALLFLDLDDFKSVNDSFGHGYGDRFLMELATRVRSSLRTEDTVARVGGDEFIVLLNDLTTDEDAARVATKVLDAVRAPFRLDGHEVSIAASLGMSVYPGDGTSPDELVRSADAAMYRDKLRTPGRDPSAVLPPGALGEDPRRHRAPKTAAGRRLPPPRPADPRRRRRMR